MYKHSIFFFEQRGLWKPHENKKTPQNSGFLRKIQWHLAKLLVTPYPKITKKYMTINTIEFLFFSMSKHCITFVFKRTEKLRVPCKVVGIQLSKSTCQVGPCIETA